MDCWHDEIQNATSEAQVMKGASDFLRLWAPRGMDPEVLGLKALRIDRSDDIERVKTRLAGLPSEGSTPTHSHLRELAEYFFHAAERLSDIRRAHDRPVPIPYLREPVARPSAQS